jgi:hypothetical protein
MGKVNYRQEILTQVDHLHPSRDVWHVGNASSGIVRLYA